MPITVQQFDFIAETMGLSYAFEAAEQAGGVTGTRDQATQLILPGEGVTPPAGMGESWGGGLTSGGGQYMPGTVKTDTSVGIGEAGTQASGLLGLMGARGGGVATAAQKDTLAGLMGLGAEADTSAYLPNAPFTEDMPVAPKAPTALEALIARANAGEILPVSEIATLERTDQYRVAKIVLGNYIAHMQQMGKAQDIEGINNSFRGIYDLYQAFYEPGGADIDVLMKAIATERGATGFFDGYEEALRTAGQSLGGEMPTTAGDQSFDFKLAALPLQGTDKDIFDFLTGLYKKQSDSGLDPNDSINSMLNEGADWMIGEPGLFGETFTNRTDAYNFLRDWLYSPTQGNVMSTEGWGAFTDAVKTMEPWTGTAPTTQVTPTVAGTPTPTTGGFDMGGLGQYGTWETLRPFGQIYPGFTSLLPGYGGSPAVQSAYAQAAAPLEMQYLARQATTPLEAPGTGEIGSDVKAWLQNVQAGSQPLMQGQDYASFLNQLSGVLGAEGARIPGMDVNVQSKMAGLFQDPQAQLAAFMNPFYQATSGAPQVRNALMDQIQQAAQRYQYQEPSGAFLPWAIEQNIGGIQGILPGLANWGPVGR